MDDEKNRILSREWTPSQLLDEYEICSILVTKDSLFIKKCLTCEEPVLSEYTFPNKTICYECLVIISRLKNIRAQDIMVELKNREIGKL